ncbi:MAG: FAD-binding oxidoreductase [Alphaproteobacteria bacterium]|nr:FAD-binding oxidoreductase [Alphaproteobacteria bacterium]
MAETVGCDVVVIGAGIAGSSAAFHLASQGVKTVLVEREHPASGPTGKSSAVCHYFYTVPELSRLARRGIQILKDIPRSCGGPVVFHSNGVLWAAGENNADEFARAIARIRDEEGGGIAALAPVDIARMAPGFDLAGIVLAAWEDEQGYADPYDAANALTKGARDRGAVYLGNRTVTRFAIAGGRFTGVELSDGTKVAADRAVVAAGPWTKSLLRPLGIDLPLHVERHAMAVLNAPGVATTVLPFSWVDDIRSHYARPEGANTILIGTWAGGGTGIRNPDAAEKPKRVAVVGDYDAGVSTAESVWIVEQMAPRVPAVADLGIRPGYACMYDMSPDDLPIIDRVPGVEGIAFAAGSSGHGFKLGPAVGEEVARLATTGPSALIAPFSLARFA